MGKKKKKIIQTLKVVSYDDGSCVVEGPIDSLLVTTSMLADAMKTLVNHNLKNIDKKAEAAIEPKLIITK